MPVNVTDFGAATMVRRGHKEGAVCLSTTWEDQQLDEDKVGDGAIKEGADRDWRRYLVGLS